MLNGTFWLPVWNPWPHIQGNYDTGALICPLESGGASADPPPAPEAEQPAAKARVRRAPGGPSLEALEAHAATHLPFRDWCRHCIFGKAPDWPHKKLTHTTDEVPMCQLDYFFLNRRGDTYLLTVLNFIHVPSGAPFVMVCEKGAVPYVVEGVLAFMEFIGLQKVS